MASSSEEKGANQALPCTGGSPALSSTGWHLNYRHYRPYPDDASSRSKQARVDRFFSYPPYAAQSPSIQPLNSTLMPSFPSFDPSPKSRQTEPRSGASKVHNTSMLPLAERMRPSSVAEVLGQDHLLGHGCILRSLLEGNSMASVIFWGPPGTGKTSLARAISRSISCRFVTASAVTSGVKEVREILEEAKHLKKPGQRTLFFMDEVHRFNKAQQDAFLPYIEAGDVIFIGATTENPSFELNSALLSRCKVLTLSKIQPAIIKQLLQRSISNAEKGVLAAFVEDPFVREIEADDDALDFLAEAADGDARVALNALEIAVTSAVSREKQRQNEVAEEKTSQPAAESTSPGKTPNVSQEESRDFKTDVVDAITSIDIENDHDMIRVRLADISEALQRSHLLYDKKGEEHYNVISALHKSMRGGDADAAIYWLARMLEGGEGPLYVARRLVRFAGEDVGLADPQALSLSVACYQACHFLGMPECNVHLAQCVAYLALAPKSVAVYKAIETAQQLVKRRGNEPVPLHLRNAPTRLMKQAGYGRGYIYPPDHEGPVEQDYFPPSLKGHKLLNWP